MLSKNFLSVRLDMIRQEIWSLHLERDYILRTVHFSQCYTTQCIMGISSSLLCPGLKICVQRRFYEKLLLKPVCLSEQFGTSVSNNSMGALYSSDLLYIRCYGVSQIAARWKVHSLKLHKTRTQRSEFHRRTLQIQNQQLCILFFFSAQHLKYPAQLPFPLIISLISRYQ